MGPLAYAAQDGGEGDEAGLQLIEQVAICLGDGKDAEDLPQTMIIDVAVDGAPAMTCQASLMWSEGEDPGEWNAYASPMCCTRGMCITRAGRRYFNAVMARLEWRSG